MTKTAALILAAGKGTRMHSDKPKVLQTLLQVPMLSYVIAALDNFLAGHIWTVVGHKAQMICDFLGTKHCRFIVQKDQRGTGHALQVALPALLQEGYESCLIINGDVPLIDVGILQDFIEASKGAKLSFATLQLDDAGSYGRVLRADGLVQGIVEAKDYDLKIHGPTSGEVNSGLYYIDLNIAKEFLPRLECNNNSAEYYITDLVHMLVRAGIYVLGVQCGNSKNLLGVNSPLELSQAEEYLRVSIVNKAMKNGAIIHAPSMVQIGPNVVIESGAEIFGPCEIYGSSHVESGAIINSQCKIYDSHIHANAQILSFCHIENSVVQDKAVVGPYARLRLGAYLGQASKVGNFVEVKKSHIGNGAKVSHLSYIGDAQIGEEANIGAGTITCNYDGLNKHQTSIGKKAFIGSNTCLVAPVVVGEQALVGAGSVITKDVPSNNLGITRSTQKNLPLRGKKT